MTDDRYSVPLIWPGFLGPVARVCLRQVPCPVVVVAPDYRRARDLCPYGAAVTAGTLG